MASAVPVLLAYQQHIQANADMTSSLASPNATNPTTLNLLTCYVLATVALAHNKWAPFWREGSLVDPRVATARRGVAPAMHIQSNRRTLRERAFWASSSRLFGGDVVSRELTSS